MNVYRTVCACSAPVAVKKSGECRRCYNKRLRWQKGTQPFVSMAESVKACSYTHAHYKVGEARGAAGNYTCDDCTDLASCWVYKGGSAYEQDSISIEQIKGQTVTKRRVWSANVQDYVPLCRTCSLIRDGK